MALNQSLRNIPGLDANVTTLLAQLDRLDRQIQVRLAEALRDAHWQHDTQRCQAIEGIGPLTAAALAARRNPVRHDFVSTLSKPRT